MSELLMMDIFDTIIGEWVNYELTRLNGNRLNNLVTITNKNEISYTNIDLLNVSCFVKMWKLLQKFSLVSFILHKM